MVTMGKHEKLQDVMALSVEGKFMSSNKKPGSEEKIYDLYIHISELV